MGDFTYFSNLFEVAAQMYATAESEQQYVTVAVNLTTNEQTGNEQVGAVTYASGLLVCQPARFIEIPSKPGVFFYWVPAQFMCPVPPVPAMSQLLNTTTTNGGNQPFDYAEPYSLIGISLTEKIVVTLSNISRTTGMVVGQPQQLTGVSAAANVLYGIGSEIAGTTTPGGGALYTISLTDPEYSGMQ
jgi:hypothetical protein